MAELTSSVWPALTPIVPLPLPAGVGVIQATLLVTSVDFQTGSTFPLWVKLCGHSSSTYGMLLSLNGVLITRVPLSLMNLTPGKTVRMTAKIGACGDGVVAKVKL